MLVPPIDMPAVAWLTIRVVLFGAIPKIRLRSSKVNAEMMKVVLRSKYLKVLPQGA